MKNRLLPAVLLGSLGLVAAASAMANVQPPTDGSRPDRLVAGQRYGNLIPDRSFPVEYTEICVKGDQVWFDVHGPREGTAGGRCEPGDVGWVITREEQAARSFVAARESCESLGMRLPDVLEWQLSCRNAHELELERIIGGREWAANRQSTLLASMVDDGQRRQRQPGTMMGEAWCDGNLWNFTATFAREDVDIGERAFRCAQ